MMRMFDDPTPEEIEELVAGYYEAADEIYAEIHTCGQQPVCDNQAINRLRQQETALRARGPIRAQA